MSSSLWPLVTLNTNVFTFLSHFFSTVDRFEFIMMISHRQFTSMLMMWMFIIDCMHLITAPVWFVSCFDWRHCALRETLLFWGRWSFFGICRGTWDHTQLVGKLSNKQQLGTFLVCTARYFTQINLHFGTFFWFLVFVDYFLVFVDYYVYFFCNLCILLCEVTKLANVRIW